MEITTPSVTIEQLPVVTSNLATLKGQVAKYLANFNFVVTDDGLKFAREKATELKKAADALDGIRKKIVKQASAPISAFDVEAKEIVRDILSVRDSLTSQIHALQQAELDGLSALLEGEIQSLWRVHGVNREFQRANVEGLLLLGNITDGGRLTKKTAEQLLERVLADKALQDKVSGRLLALDGACLKAGLKSPFGRHNIEHFLFATNDEAYEKSLNDLINAEIRRQEETEARIKAQVEAKAQREIEAAMAKAETEKKALEEANQKAIQEAVAEAQKTIPVKTIPVNNVPLKDGNVKYTISVHLELEYKDMEIGKLEKAVLKKFADAGFKSVRGVDIEKIPAQAQIVPKRQEAMVGSFF